MGLLVQTLWSFRISLIPMFDVLFWFCALRCIEKKKGGGGAEIKSRKSERQWGESEEEAYVKKSRKQGHRIREDI